MKTMFGLLVTVVLSAQVLAAEPAWETAQIMSNEAKSQLSTGSNVGDNFHEVVFQLADKKVTARTYSMGGGMLYIVNHPLDFAVGANVQVALGKRADLQVKLSSGKVVKFMIRSVDLTKD